MGFDIPNPYKGDYRLLAIAPIALVAISLFLIFVSPGIQKGVDFKGGILVTLSSNQSIDNEELASSMNAEGFNVLEVKSVTNPTGTVTEIELARNPNLEVADALKSDFYNQFTAVSKLESGLDYANAAEKDKINADYAAALSRLQSTADAMFNISKSGKTAESFNSTIALRNAVIADWSSISEKQNSALRTSLAKHVEYNTASFDEVTSSLSAKFFETATHIAIASTLLTIVVVFLIFRAFVPSVAVLTGALCDITIAMGAMALFQIPLTLASFAALLMLVGFSLDTDVLLTVRVVKRKEGHASDRAYEAMKTGMTMSFASIVAFSALFILASLTNLRIYYEISSVALMGLVGDIIATWCLNAVIILHYMEEQEKKGGVKAVKSITGMLFRE